MNKIKNTFHISSILNLLKRKYYILFILLYPFMLTLGDNTFPASQAFNYSDSAVYQYIGHLILSGKYAYRDAFDHKGILLYFINALECYISYDWGIWLVDYIFMIGIIYFSYKTIRLMFSSMLSIIICSIVYIDFQFCFWIGNTPDYYAVFFESVSIYLFLSMYKNKEIQNLYCIIIGICMACCFWMKPTTLAPVALYMVFFLRNLFKKERRSSICKCLMCFLCGFFIPTILLYFYFILTQTWDQMIRDYFIFNFVYSYHDTSGNVLSVLWMFLQYTSTQVTIILCAIYFVINKNEKNIILKHNYILFSTFLTYILTVIMLIYPGRPYVQYYTICYPLLLVIIGSIISDIINALKIFLVEHDDFIGHLIRSIVNIVIPISLISTLIYSTYFSCINNWKVQDEYSEIINYINDNCSSDDAISVVSPYDCGLYLASGFESATSYPYMQILKYEDEYLKKDFNRQISLAPPKIIVWRKYWNANDFFQKNVFCNYSLDMATSKFEIYKRIK